MAYSRLAIVAALLLAAFPTRTPAAADAHWSDLFATPGVDGTVTCATTYRGGIAIGGRFSYVSGIPANNVAWWDGTQWHGLGSGTDGEVTSLIEFGEQLVVTGRFTNAGGTASNGAASWTAGAWRDMGAGLDGGANALAIFRGEIFAAGAFEHTGATPLHHVARWDGNAWRDVGFGTDGQANCFAVLNNRLYMGGAFSLAGTLPANGIAQWDGYEWHALGDGVRRLGLPAPVYALAVFTNALVAGGDFDTAGGGDAKNLAVWRNFAWESLAGGNDGPVHALAVLGTANTPSERLLVGPTYEAPSRVWQATTGWTDATPPGPYGVAHGYLYSGGLVAYGDVGVFDASFRRSATGLLRDRAGTWTGLEKFDAHTNGFPVGNRVSAIARVPGGILVGGYFTSVGSPTGWLPVDRLARWDGTRWHAYPPIPSSGAVQAVLVHGDTIDVGGEFPDSSDWHRIVPVYRLVGATWTPLDTLSIFVHSMRIHRGELVIGGARVSAVDFPDAGGAYRWDGAHWVSLGEFADHTPFKMVHTMEELDGRLVVGGGFDSVDGVPANSVAAWDGSSWSTFGAGPGRGGDYNAIYGLAVHQGSLVASGSFGNSSPGVAKWDGTSWNPLGTGWGDGLSVVASGDDLVAAISREDLAVKRWNGSSWDELGATNQGMVTSLLQDGSSLYVGGEFSEFGGRPAGDFARWDAVATPPPHVVLASGRPNPFRETIVLSYTVPGPGTVRLLVQDVHGRHVTTIESSALTGGSGQVLWDGRDASGRKAPAGVYFVTLATSDGERDSRKVVLLP